MCDNLCLSSSKHRVCSDLAVSENACLRKFVDLRVAVANGELDVVVVNESEDFVSFAISGEAPSLFIGVEVEAHSAAVVAAYNVVAFAVAFNEVFAVVTFDDTFALSHGVRAAPEFDAVENEDVRKSAHFVYGKNPESEEYEFVDEFVTYMLVPAEEAVCEREATDARRCG